MICGSSRETLIIFVQHVAYAYWQANEIIDIYVL